MSDTPISDSTPHNVADLGMQIRRIERQLNAANERIKQLEESGNEMYDYCDPSRWDSTATAARKLSAQNAWNKAKEVKL